MSDGPVLDVVGGGTPTDEEAAAVVAAMAVVLSSGAGVVDDDVDRVPAWRFSQRWWLGPAPARRSRPMAPYTRDW